MKRFCRRDLWAIRPGDELWCKLPDGDMALIEITHISLDESRMKGKAEDVALIEAISPWQITPDSLLFVAAGSKRPETAFVMSGPLFEVYRPETQAEALRLKHARRQTPAVPVELFRWGNTAFFVAPVTLATDKTIPVIVAVWPGVSQRAGEAGFNWDQVAWMADNDMQFDVAELGLVGYMPGGQGRFVPASSMGLAMKRIAEALTIYAQGGASPWHEE